VEFLTQINVKSQEAKILEKAIIAKAAAVDPQMLRFAGECIP
jgi:hypothetical protein